MLRSLADATEECERVLMLHWEMLWCSSFASVKIIYPHSAGLGRQMMQSNRACLFVCLFSIVNWLFLGLCVQLNVTVFHMFRERLICESWHQACSQNLAP